jgi:hypothetical protein
MRHVSFIAAAAALAVALAGCGEPYYPGYGNSQAYYGSQPYYGSQAYYGSQPYYGSQAYYAPSGYSYVPASNSSYSSRSDYYRNYNGIHAAPERTFP